MSDAERDALLARLQLAAAIAASEAVRAGGLAYVDACYPPDPFNDYLGLYHVAGSSAAALDGAGFAHGQAVRWPTDDESAEGYDLAVDQTDGGDGEHCEPSAWWIAVPKREGCTR